MTHNTDQNLEERLASLEGARKRSVGNGEPEVCRVCYTMFTHAGCPCGRNSWAGVSVVIAELKLLLEEIHADARAADAKEAQSTDS